VEAAPLELATGACVPLPTRTQWGPSRPPTTFCCKLYMWGVCGLLVGVAGGAAVYTVPRPGGYGLWGHKRLLGGFLRRGRHIFFGHPTPACAVRAPSLPCTRLRSCLLLLWDCVACVVVGAVGLYLTRLVVVPFVGWEVVLVSFAWRPHASGGLCLSPGLGCFLSV
jgi:hypothetical protein